MSTPETNAKIHAKHEFYGEVTIDFECAVRSIMCENPAICFARTEDGDILVVTKNLVTIN